MAEMLGAVCQAGRLVVAAAIASEPLGRSAALYV